MRSSQVGEETWRRVYARRTRRRTGFGLSAAAGCRPSEYDRSFARDRLKPVLLLGRRESLLVLLILIGLLVVRHGIRFVEPAAKINQPTAVATERHRRRLLEVNRSIADRAFGHGMADNADRLVGLLLRFFFGPFFLAAPVRLLAGVSRGGLLVGIAAVVGLVEA
jgi:hypothetical protein